MRNPFASRRASLSRALTLAGAVAPLLFPAPARALTRVPYSLEETVQRSESIFVGRVVSRTSRWTDQAKGWMRTDVVLEVEDGISGARTGDSITVSCWGGQIGDEAMGVSGVKIPLPNERFVMLLKPATEPPGISPVVGEVDGLFPVVNSAGGPVVTTADGANVALPADGGASGGQAMPPPPGGQMPLSRFTSWLRANVTALRARPLPPRPRGFLPEERVYPGQPAPETGSRAPAGPAVKPQGSPEEAASPAPPDAAPEVQPGAPVSGVKGGGGVSILYNFLGPAASLPITFNQLPPNLSPWAGVDQAMMAKWNYYADVFRVRGTPTGGFAWGNDRFDMCGFPSSATMQSVFGEPWGGNTLGICYWRSRNNVLIEADISLNPAYSWTLDDEWVFGGGSAWSFRNVMLHELGHAWGLDHNFRGISVMNYVLQEVGPLLSMPFMDDAEAIRRRYTGAVQNVADVGVYLFNLGTPNSSGDYPWWDEASFPFSARAGESFNASGFHVENVGTVEKNVVVEWYLSAARNFDGPYHHMRTIDYGSLPRFYQFNPITTSLTIPSSIPEGDYFLATFVRNDGGPTQAGFPRDNNRAFTRRALNVKQRLASASPSSLTLKPGESATVRVSLHGPSSGARVTLGGALPTLDYPSGVTVPTGSTSATFTLTARTVSVPTTSTLTAAYGANVPITVRIEPNHTMADVRKALRATAGLGTLTVAEADFLNVERVGSSASVVDLRDVVHLIRKVNGLGS